MNVLKRKDFAWWQASEKLPDAALCMAVREMESGLFDADLGGSLYKKRGARSGGGKSGGYRVLLSARIGRRYVFLHGFSKSNKANITSEERQALQYAGRVFLELSSESLSKALQVAATCERYEQSGRPFTRPRSSSVAGLPESEARHRASDARSASITGATQQKVASHQVCYRRYAVSSKIIESLRGDLAALQAAGGISKVTMREFDAICPPPVRAFSAGDIKRLRERLKFSQPVFAHHLHTSASTVRKWEQGDTHPSGPALKLLNIIADKGLQAII